MLSRGAGARLDGDRGFSTRGCADALCLIHDLHFGVTFIETPTVRSSRNRMYPPQYTLVASTAIAGVVASMGPAAVS